MAIEHWVITEPGIANDERLKVYPEIRRLRHKAKRCLRGRKIYPVVLRRYTISGEKEHYSCSWCQASPPKQLIDVAILAQVDFESTK